MYAVSSYALNTTQNNARDSFRLDLESIRRDLKDLRNSTNSTSCLICSRRAITSKIEPKTCLHYHSVYDQRFVKPTKSHVVPNYVFGTLPETRPSWESSWTKNENYRFMEPTKLPGVPNYIVPTLPETRSPWESSWTKNDNHYNYPQRPWTTSRYVP
ncbi:unnamed protein product [Rotaria magnacalcarata]|uniref:Uncharacterized protein n=1 Tax=Rotaria magnacalcarata TaxID=392030 RepID=A0A816P737_9BILA|nr:unnamed protein product [Rotaria magnacalcarata]CAF4176283.1 unnamed protein product [Rotaria magnacalcarata]